MSWLVGRRSENQRLLLHILKFADGRPPVVDWRHVLALEGSVSCGRETLHDVDPQ